VEFRYVRESTAAPPALNTWLSNRQHSAPHLLNLSEYIPDASQRGA
jgi:hypothetical protein